MPKAPADGQEGPVRITILSEGNPLKDTVGVIAVEVFREFNKIPSARLTFADGNMPEQTFPLSDEDVLKPGSEITIKLGYDSDEIEVFKGLVVKHGISIDQQNNSTLVVECKDKAVGMTLIRKNANHIKVKDSDICTTLIGETSGLSADVEATKTKYEEVVQYLCTDWDFILTRAEVNGQLVNVEDSKVSIKAPEVSASPVLKVDYGDDLIKFQADVDAAYQFASVDSVCWDPKTQKAVKESVKPKALNAQGNLSTDDLAKVLGVDPYRLQTPVPLEKAVLKDWATGQNIKSGLSRIRGRMTFKGDPAAKVGKLITLSGVGKRFDGDVFVSSVSHEVRDGQWLTEVGFGLSSQWFSEKRDSVVPPASGLLPGVEGLQIGVVMKLDGDPEKENKIQVSVPVLQAKSEGVWARLATYYASESFGNFFIPEVGDEVVLGYFNNDPSNPVILGSLYSSKRKPPYELTKENYIKAIVTKSKLKIEFDDENKITTIITPSKNKIVLSDKDKSILLQDMNDNKVELSKSGIVMDSPKDIKISAKGKISIDAMGAIDISSKADVGVKGLNIKQEAQASFSAKGNASAELSASGQTVVKGALVMIN